MDGGSLKTFIIEMQNSLVKTNGIKRYAEDNIYRSFTSKPIKIITGFRRSGKSFLVKQLAKRLVNEAVYTISNILYLNFEHYQIRDINSPEGLDRVFKLFRREIASKGKMLLIFDEIQMVDNWDAFIRTIYEMYGEELEIILTGSNSELLSSELGTNLAGRFIEFSLLPFSFKEYLTYYKMEINNDIDFIQNSDEIMRYFNEYRNSGGLPEICTIVDESTKFSYLQGIVSKVILDDIIKRFNIKNADIIEKILYFMNINVGNVVSFSKLGQYLKTVDSKITSDTVILYVNCIIKAFTLFEISKLDWKQNRVFETTRKFYSIDTGIVNSFDQTVRNHSKLLENIVFIELKRRDQKIYFGALKGGKEIDFIAKESRHGKYTKYQVTVELNEKNNKREINNFLVEDTVLQESENILLVLHGESKDFLVKEKLIKQRNLIKWLLEIE